MQGRLYAVQKIEVEIFEDLIGSVLVTVTDRGLAWRSLNTKVGKIPCGTPQTSANISERVKIGHLEELYIPTKLTPQFLQADPPR